MANANPATPIRAPRCTELAENATIGDFLKWKSCLEFNLIFYKQYTPFLADNATWSTSSVLNRGLLSDADSVEEADRQTGAQKNATLEQMLGLIAQYSPSLLRNDIIRKSYVLDME